MNDGFHYESLKALAKEMGRPQPRNGSRGGSGCDRRAQRTELDRGPRPVPEAWSVLPVCFRIGTLR
jgi:hypothetical protein